MHNAKDEQQRVKKYCYQQVHSAEICSMRESKLSC